MPKRTLVGLLVAFGLLASVYSLNTPLFEAPDEPWHYAYVRWLAEGRGLPRLDDDASGAQQEVAQPPLYYLVAALMSGIVADDDLSDLFWHNPQFGFQAGGTVNDNKNMLIHTDRERFPWRDAVLAVRLARLVSWGFGLLAVGAAYGLVREALPTRPALAIVAVGLVAFTPQFLFMSGVVSNDSAAAATATLALWALARIIRLGPTPRRAAVAGLAIGLALLSKTSALLLLPIALVAVCGIRDVRHCKWREALLMLGVAAAVGGWWYLRNWILFDDPLGLRVHVNTPWGRSQPARLADLLGELPQVFRSFWGAFGWGHVELSAILYITLGVFVGLALLGWVRLFFRHKADTRTSARSAATASTLEMGRRRSAGTWIFLLAAIWCIVVLAALLRWMQQVEAPHGRLLFPALGAWGLLLAMGWSSLITRPGATRAGTENVTEGHVLGLLQFLPVIGLFLLALIVPFAFIRPAFARPALLAPEEAAERVTPYALVYDNQARLLGYLVDPESGTAGGRVRVTLCWEALRPMDQDYTLFIHLLGRENLRVAERRTYPGQGRFPTTLWPVNRAFCDSYGLDVAPWAPAPELYALEVGLYDAASGQRLPAQDAIGQTVALPAVGLVRVAPVTTPPPPAYTVSYDLGAQIALIGYDALTDPDVDSPALVAAGSTALGSGDTLTLTLYWQARQVPQGDYTVFVHLLDERGELIAQDDAAPRGGRYPTWAWQPGDLVSDPHRVTLPEHPPRGSLHWSVGMYDPETLDRLPVVGPEGAVPNGAIPLGEALD